MKKRVNTIADIAVIAGVSKSTVSRALNNSPLISTDTRERIQEIADHHHFEAHKGAQALSLNKSKTLALISPLGEDDENIINDPFLTELLKSVIKTTANNGYDLLISQPKIQSAREILRYLESNRTDGVMILGCGINEVLSGVAKEGGVITAGADAPANLCSVDCDNKQGGYLATEHLVQQGCKRVAFLGGIQTGGETALRYQGYLDALKKNGIIFDEQLVKFGDYTGRAGYQRVTQWLSEGVEFDGLFSCSDLMAIGAIEALRENGRVAGKDTAVVGFDDIPMAEYSSPPLTTIRQDIERIGATMVNSLLQNLQNGAITKTILPVELVIRKSSILKK